MSFQDPFDAAYQAYVKALVEAAVSQDVQLRATEAYAAYLQVLQEMWSADLQNRAEDAYRNYVRVVQEALGSDDVQKRADQAYGDYVRALKDAWTKADVNLIDVPSLTAISQSMMSVAWTATTGAGDSDNTSAPLGAADPQKTAAKS